MKKVFELTWDDDLGEDWMNIFNLESCLFSEEHTKRELIKVKEKTNEKKKTKGED